MGNTLVKAESNRTINDSILGNRVKEILRESYIPSKDDNGKDIPLKINKMVACCTNNTSTDNNTGEKFITIKLPSIMEPSSDKGKQAFYEKICVKGGRCIESSNLGLSFPNTQCGEYQPQSDKCNTFMVDKCAKELYDAGCLKIKVNKNGKKVRVWDATNKNCFDMRGNLIYGNEECRCINSATGFTLNNDPSTKFSKDPYSRFQNPYGLEGPSSGSYSGDLNKYTKYSMDIFGYPRQNQYPQVFDSRCAANDDGNKLTGISNPYLLGDYKKTPSICLNQINIKDSDIGQANLSNIKQNNNCGTGSNTPVKIEENPKEREARINKEKEVKRREAERLEKEKKEKLEAERVRKEKEILAEEMAAEKKRLDMIKAIQDQAEAKKAIEDLEKEKQRIQKEKQRIEEEKQMLEEEKEYEKQQLADQLSQAEQQQQQTQEKVVQMETKAEEKQKEQEEKQKEQEEEDLKEEQEDNQQKRLILIGGSLLFFVIIILVILLLLRGGNSDTQN